MSHWSACYWLENNQVLHVLEKTSPETPFNVARHWFEGRGENKI